jgi:uncharacterized protein (DUF427 family)
MKRIVPARGQESVWDYPRPPRLEACDREITIVFGGQTIVTTSDAQRVLETSHPPVYYIPIKAIQPGVLRPSDQQTFCEWKGVARYFDVVVEDFIARNAAWGYESPTTAFAAIHDHVAFYAHLMDACYVGGEQVQPQPGGFYGGWVTDDIVGPFKGQPGTQGW